LSFGDTWALITGDGCLDASWANEAISVLSATSLPIPGVQPTTQEMEATLQVLYNIMLTITSPYQWELYVGTPTDDFYQIEYCLLGLESFDQYVLLIQRIYCCLDSLYKLQGPILQPSATITPFMISLYTTMVSFLVLPLSN